LSRTLRAVLMLPRVAYMSAAHEKWSGAVCVGVPHALLGSALPQAVRSGSAALLRLFDDAQPQRLSKFHERFFDVSIDGHPVPAELAPFVEELADVAADFGE